MNVLLTDIPDRPGRPAAEPAFHPKVEHDINQSTQTFVVDDLGGHSDLEDRLFRDLDQQCWDLILMPEPPAGQECDGIRDRLQRACFGSGPPVSNHVSS